VRFSEKEIITYRKKLQRMVSDVVFDRGLA